MSWNVYEEDSKSNSPCTRAALGDRMKIGRCSVQKSSTLREFYGGDKEHQQVFGQPMLRLLDELEARESPYTVFGLTSHFTLVLLPSDDYAQQWAVTVVWADRYVVRCLLPDGQGPWRDATAEGNATDVSTAADLLLKAMELSERWPSRE